MIFDQKLYEPTDSSVKSIKFLNDSIRCGFISNNQEHTEDKFSTGQYAIVYIVKGSGTFSNSDGVWDFTDGYIFQRLPDQKHSVTYSSDTLRFYVAVPKEILSLMNLTDENFNKSPVHRTRNGSNLLEKIHALYKRCCTEDKIYIILPLIQLYISDCIKAADEYLLDNIESNLPVMERATLLLSDMESNDSLDTIAYKLSMNYHSFRRKFREFSGLSPGNYRLQKKIKAACSLLLTTNKSVTEVSIELGYKDIYTFSAQFKKLTGLSPINFTKKVNG